MLEVGVFVVACDTVPDVVGDRVSVVEGVADFEGVAVNA